MVGDVLLFILGLWLVVAVVLTVVSRATRPDERQTIALDGSPVSCAFCRNEAVEFCPDRLVWVCGKHTKS